MIRRNVFLFLISTAISFVAFTAIALLLQWTGLGNNASPTAQTETVLPSPASITDATNPLLSLDSQEQAWLALGITHYRLRVSITQNGVIYGLHAYTVEVNSEQVTPITLECFDPNGCDNLSLNLSDYTVTSLFTTARTLLSEEDLWRTEVTYDPVYHFPILIYNDPPDPIGMNYDENVWSVSEFEPLP